MVVVGINIADESRPTEKAQAFQQKHGLTYPVLVDETGKVAEAYRVKGLPTNVIIDREGTVRYIAPGFNPEVVTQTLQDLLRQ